MERNPAARKAEILSAAIGQFAHHGRSGARVDQIALAAGLNKRLLYHYVGDKAALFDACAHACLEWLAGSRAALDIDEADAWRVLAQADGDLSAEDWTALSNGLGGSNGGDLAAIRVALQVLTRLFPGLADELLQGGTGWANGDPAAQELLERVGRASAAAPAAKPRIKLRPDLRLDQARSASNRSK
jgi:AcrR family transcriptional regulator